MYKLLDHNSSVPLHQQAEEWLRQLIRSEVYQNGQPIPPETLLAQQLHISRNTLRQAISRLVFEGILVRKRRQGTCVSGKSVQPGSRPLVSGQLIKPGMRHHTIELHVSYCRPSEAALVRFHIQYEKRVLKMERLNGTTSGPVEYVIAEFNPLLPVSASENFHRPLSFILEKIHHLPIKKIQETLYAAAADPLVALKLKIEPGAPLLVQKRYIYTTDEMPAVLGTSYYNADSFAYSVEHQYI